MNEIKLTDKDYRKILDIASNDFMNISYYDKVFEKLTVEIIINAVMKFFSISNFIVANGRIYKADADETKKEFEELYNKLNDKSKYEYVIKRDKVLLLHKMERLEKDLKKANKELDKLKKERSRWN